MFTLVALGGFLGAGAVIPGQVCRPRHDHCSRAMRSHAVHLAACGYEHHGPRGHLGFAPRLSPEDFRAAPTAAGGLGLYRQRRTGRRKTSSIKVRHGRLRRRSLPHEVPGPPPVVSVRASRRRQHLADLTADGGRVEIRLDRPVAVAAGESVEVMLVGPPGHERAPARRDVGAR